MVKDPVHISFVKGETYSAAYAISQSGTPVNITGATLQGQIRNGGDNTLAASFSMSIADAANGSFTASLSPSTTATLDPAGKYIYNILITYASGVKHEIAQGEVNVKRQITQ